ncbi:hypothetical protein N8996_03470 [Candidatus Poseidonia alphae]|nr:hypothetical protein [Candidatus Poseidonia alphae]
MKNNPTNEMMQLIANHVNHNEYEHYLDEAKLSVEEMLVLSDELYNLHSARWNIQEASNNHGVNPFDVISLLDARVAIFARCGNEGYADWMQNMWDLAIRYSDQAGLSRKFSLFAELVASTKADLSREEHSVFFYTRALTDLPNSLIIGLARMKQDRCGKNSWSMLFLPWKKVNNSKRSM